MAHESHRLALLITDWWNPLGSWSSGIARSLHSSLLVRGAGRRAEGIPNAKVVSLWPRSVGLSYYIGSSSLRRRSYAALLHEWKWFSERCVDHLAVDHSIFIGFGGECLEALQFEQRQGVRRVVDRVDAGRDYHRILRDEARRFGELALPLESVPDAYYQRLEMELALADHIVVNSDYSKRALVAEGAPEDRVVVIPVAYRPFERPRQPRRCSQELRVLWLGRLCLAKGLPYAVEAARLVSHLPIRFTFAGSSAVRHERIKWPANSSYIGPVPRLNVAGLYQEHDVFLFPTLSDGFGITQIEAMAFGLPVIATRYCGEVVVNGESGFVVESRSPSEIADCLSLLLDRPELLSDMSLKAVKRAERFAPASVWRQYSETLSMGVRSNGVSE